MKERIQQKLRHYEDSKCTWGYMTFCENCVKDTIPSHVDISKQVYGFPYVHCDRCGQRTTDKLVGNYEV